MRKIYLLIIFLTASTDLIFAQSGTLKGKIIDKDKNEPIPFANVVAELNGVQETLTAAQAEIVTLKAEAKTAEARAAEIYGATRKPLAVTPGGDPKASDATIAKLDAFEAIDDPTAQANAWNAFTQPEREALIAAQKARKNSKSR